MTKLLVQEYNANVNTKDSRGNTPLHVVSKLGNKTLLKVLLTKEPDLTILNNEGYMAS